MDNAGNMPKPFTIDNCEGYSAEEMAALNAEFAARWNGWDVKESQLFLYANGKPMEEDVALAEFWREVAGR